MSEVHEIANDLMAFGLTRNQATIFAFLIFGGSCDAEGISNLTRIAREEVYRILKKLERVGYIDVMPDRPTRYAAASIKKIIDSQIAELESRKKSLEDKAVNLLSKLEKMKKVHDEEESAGIRFNITLGRKRGYSILTKMWSNAEREILYTTSKSGLRRAILLDYHPFNVAKECNRRGVTIRVLSDIDQSNLEETKAVRKLCQLRHVKDQNSHLHIIDGRQVMVGIVVHDSDPSVDVDACDLLTNAPDYVSVMVNFFEAMWNSAIESKERISELKGDDR